MDDRECVELLQWAMPRLGLRWRGFKNLRRQVCRRIAARIGELGLVDVASYRQRLEEDVDELRVLDSLCFVTISRFYRDRSVFDALRDTHLPRLAEAARARGDRVLRAWCAGCASGEEPYTLAIVWRIELAHHFPDITLDILATDFDATVLARAARGCYAPSSLSELPESYRSAAFAFDVAGDLACVRPRFREGITFERRDVRAFVPGEPQDLVLCRNVAFTYFDEAAQRAFVERVTRRLVPGGLLVVGGHETIPDGIGAGELGLTASADSPHVYVRTPTGASATHVRPDVGQVHRH